MMVLCARVCVGAPKCPHHHQTHQTTRPHTSTREFDVSLDCVWLSGLTLSAPDQARGTGRGATFWCSSTCHARATTCAHPNDPGPIYLNPLGGVSKLKSGLGALKKSHFFFSPFHDALGCAAMLKTFVFAKSCMKHVLGRLTATGRLGGERTRAVVRAC